MKRAMTLAVMLACAWRVHAEPGCENALDQPTINECVSRAYMKSDAELNRVYRSLATRARGEEVIARKLAGAQRAWIAFRDAECDFKTAGSAGGSANPSARLSCLDELTRARTVALKAYLTCQEGDLNCPVPSE